VGDIDPACAEIASYITPVPGGVGPVTVVKLFINLVF
jgi:5,10-methylene-tetrahydrofolate dehydrogenase/methenyl tetrahydrofolate cyclohydrolase